MEGENGEERYVGREVAVEEDDETLKRRISTHPLFGLLVDTHLNCLKVSIGEIVEAEAEAGATNEGMKVNSTVPSSSDLDHFMEAYCMALSKLKEDIKEPVQETSSFINAKFIQLRELSGTSHPKTPKPCIPPNHQY